MISATTATDLTISDIQIRIADIHVCRMSCRFNSGREDEPQLTFRAVGTGLLVGSLLCCSNTYFGLQTGWVTMGSLQVIPS